MSKFKLFAANAAMESELTNEAKIQVLGFLKEASDAQVKSFIMDGKISVLDEQAEQIVNDRFEAIHREAVEQEIMNESVGGSLLGIAISPAGWLIYRGVRRAFDGCTKKCGTLKLDNIKRQNCMTACKIEKLNKELGLLSKSMAACKDDGCKAKAAKAISKQKVKISQAKAKLAKIQHKGGSYKKVKK